MNLNFIHNLQAMSTSYSCTFESFSVFLILLPPPPSFASFYLFFFFFFWWFFLFFFLFSVGFVFFLLVCFGLVLFSPTPTPLPSHLILTSRFGVVLNRQGPKHLWARAASQWWCVKTFKPLASSAFSYMGSTVSVLRVSY